MFKRVLREKIIEAKKKVRGGFFQQNCILLFVRIKQILGGQRPLQDLLGGQRLPKGLDPWTAEGRLKFALT